jgi:hypothetical protein
MKTPTLFCLVLSAAISAAANLTADPANPASGPAAATAAPVEIKLDDAHSNPILGDYLIAPGMKFTVTREDGHLYTMITNQPKVEIFATSDTEFFLKKVDAQLTFVKGADGKVTSVILHQMGQDQEWPKAQ